MSPTLKVKQCAFFLRDQTSYIFIGSVDMVDIHASSAADGDIHIGSGQTNTTPGSVVRIMVPSLTEKVTVIFIGGAGDERPYYFAGPYHNIAEAKKYLDAREVALHKQRRYESLDLGYYEVHSRSDIQANVMDVIPSKTAPVYIIGHSLGGWNGAHLSRALADAGYNVVVLVTLDPVGGGSLVKLGSAIFFHPEPEPRAKVWINVHATPRHPDPSDSVANFGERWVIKSGPNVNVDADVNHENAKALFTTMLANGMTVADIVDSSIRSWTTHASSQPSL
jgi:pimeloyl-ACP methyl ester carboxylesterase